MRVVLAHESVGGGPTKVLMLHGYLGSSRNLGALARAWTAKKPSVQLVHMDLPGHGRSPPLAPGDDLYSMAKAVLETCDALAFPERFAVVGHSLGGRVACAARQLAPHRVERLALLDIAPGPIREGARPADLHRGIEAFLALPARATSREAHRDALLEAGLSRDLTAWLLMNLVRDGAELVWRVDRAALHDFGERTKLMDLWPAIEDHAGPEDLAVVAGRSSYVIAEDTARYEAAGVRVLVIEDAGHFVHVDATEPVLEAILARWE